eukprot:m.29662 g.29662  ORF g.29662 m.29662 type:complete len:114 (-) comp9190_c3_seq1:83-424(-)
MSLKFCELLKEYTGTTSPADDRLFIRAKVKHGDEEYSGLFRWNQKIECFTCNGQRLRFKSSDPIEILQIDTEKWDFASTFAAADGAVSDIELAPSTPGKPVAKMKTVKKASGV